MNSPMISIDIYGYDITSVDGDGFHFGYNRNDITDEQKIGLSGAIPDKQVYRHAYSLDRREKHLSKIGIYGYRIISGGSTP